MGLISTRISDASGEVLDGDYVIIVVRGHSLLNEAKQLDVSEAEAKSIKTVDGLVEVELRSSNGETTTVHCTEAELAKVVPLDVLQKADGIRGRRRGYHPKT